MDKWYCERCLKNNPQLQITFKDDHGTGEVGNLTATAPPGSCSGTSARLGPTSAAKKTYHNHRETYQTDERRALNGRSAHTEPQAEVAVAQTEQPPPNEASANANPMVEEHAAVAQGPTVAALLEQLKQAAARNKQLEEENTALLREKTAATAAKEGLQTAWSEAKTEAAAKRQKRIAAEEGLKKAGEGSKKAEEGLKKALDDTKAEAATEHEKRIAAKEE
ncbi:hypothetical protein AAVH_30678, partial [Aphelenchoides avenae]